MELSAFSLGFPVGDGEGIELQFAGGDLLLRFTDWREQPVEHRFVEALAFRWSARSTVETPRDDATYQVLDSAWLADEVGLEGYSTATDFAHYVLCFNAAKVLEVVCRRI